MVLGIRTAAVSLSVLMGLGLTPIAARAADAPSKACIAQADKQKLHGAARQSSLTKCMKAVTSPTSPNPQLQASAITSPSGASPAQRAGQCSAEAERRHLQYPARQSFQHNCLSGIGPVTSIGTALHTPAKTTAKPALGEVSNGQQH